MKRILSSLLVLVLCFSFFTSAFAANVCGHISGDAQSTTTFTVDTGKRWIFSDKLTFTQTKGTYIYNTPLSYHKTATGYMRYKVSYRIKGKSGWTTKNWTGKKLTLSLKKNTIYEVKVAPMNNADTLLSGSTKQIQSWKKVATWQVTSTKGIISCY